MGSGDLLHVQPSELKFSSEARKQSFCIMQMTSTTDQYVAFKIKTTSPRKYCVRPNSGVVTPGSACIVTVTLQPQREAPPDLKCNDKFLVQCVVASVGATVKDVTADMFNKDSGNEIREFKLKVVYVPANLPSPVPEEPEEGLSPPTNVAKNGGQGPFLFDNASRCLDETDKAQNLQAIVAKFTKERNSAVEMNQKLQQELELLRKESCSRRGGSFSFMFVALVGAFSILLGYLINKKQIGQVV